MPQIESDAANWGSIGDQLLLHCINDDDDEDEEKSPKQQGSKASLFRWEGMTERSDADYYPHPPTMYHHQQEQHQHEQLLLINYTPPVGQETTMMMTSLIEKRVMEVTASLTRRVEMMEAALVSLPALSRRVEAIEHALAASPPFLQGGGNIQEEEAQMALSSPTAWHAAVLSDDFASHRAAVLHLDARVRDAEEQLAENMQQLGNLTDNVMECRYLIHAERATREDAMRKIMMASSSPAHTSAPASPSSAEGAASNSPKAEEGEKPSGSNNNNPPFFKWDVRTWMPYCVRMDSKQFIERLVMSGQPMQSAPVRAAYAKVLEWVKAAVLDHKLFYALADTGNRLVAELHQAMENSSRAQQSRP